MNVALTLGFTAVCECGRKSAPIWIRISVDSWQELPKPVQERVKEEIINEDLEEQGWVLGGWVEVKRGWERSVTCPTCAQLPPLKRAWKFMAEGMTVQEAALYLGSHWPSKTLADSLMAQYGEMPVKAS